MRRSHAVLPVLFLLILAGIGGADYFLKELPAMRAVEELASQQGNEQGGESSSSVSGQPVKKGVSRKPGPNVKEVLMAMGYTWTDVGSSEVSLVQNSWGEPVQMVTILKDGDRTAMLAWADSPDIKEVYRQLKQGLETSFSGDVTDLVDESLTPEAGPPRDILSFRDPAISPERIAFVRIRTRLYEFHIVEGNEEQLLELAERLAQ